MAGEFPNWAQDKNTIKTRTNASRSSLLTVIIVFVIITAAVTGTQGYNIGFESGHHGWVSAHSLAQIVKSTRENHFVGYTLKYISTSPWHSYYYFDRYPFPFPATFNVILQSLNGNVGETVYFARQLMNIVFLAMIVSTYALLFQISRNRIASLSATLSAFSGYYFMYYKDMVHYDQPAVVGMLLVTNTIVYYYRTGKYGPVLLAASLCVLMGRGYVSGVILLFWLFCILTYNMVIKLPALNHSFTPAARGPALSASIIALTISALFLGYNIHIESKVRQVSFSETSIVQSALKRTGLSREFNHEHKNELKWTNVVKVNSSRLYESLFPAQISKAEWIHHPLLKSLVILILICAVLTYFYSLSSTLRIGYLMVLFGAFSWVLLMRNLTIFHDYTTIYYCAFLGALFLSIYSVFSTKLLKRLILPLVLIGFFSSLHYSNELHAEHSRRLNQISEDFVEINSKLPANSTYYVPEGYRNLLDGVPYSMGYYASKHMIAGIPSADYVISATPSPVRWNLTPNNSHIFLYKIERPFRN